MLARHILPDTTQLIWYYAPSLQESQWMQKRLNLVCFCCLAAGTAPKPLLWKSRGQLANPGLPENDC